ncbi:isochorismate synthase [Cochleicola gelatinilyticus]|uniref:isochorismate synthase n=1 Tax=Cochleicola gelatinilyticus TaxID=1763537 RepID=A0A167HPW4_9FLAO|nr:isochorismate synthase [Cochleicola gelatinilyticus]OAB78839.1 hypothetical protein ULVI_09670 [Cochleicola gelatinilyticus]
MNYNSLVQQVENHYKDRKPFVLFCPPESDNIQVYLQKDSTLYTTNDFSENGFVFAPFDFNGEAICMPVSKCDCSEVSFQKETIEEYTITASEDHIEKEAYLELVRAAMTEISGKKAKKIVTSRPHTLNSKPLQLSLLLKRLLQLYPGALRYIWFHPKTDLWCGATPETLLETNGISFKTMALAGTRKINEKRPPDWTHKEIDEQQLVTDAIVQSLQRVTSVVRLSKTYTQKAGSLAHLKTDITGVLKNGKTNLATIVGTLHPTPAVCGTPQKKAKSFILEREKYQREYYTGFLGPIDQLSQSGRLFVNLRCMKITDTTITIYVGGGITAASIPEDEWNETQHKLGTMMQVVQPML